MSDFVVQSAELGFHVYDCAVASVTARVNLTQELTVDREEHAWVL